MRVTKLTSEPRKNTSIAIIGDPIPKDGTWHTFLKDLKQLEIDIFFLIDHRHSINPRKFSTLYDATYYALPDGETEQELVWKSVEYVKELGGGYTSIFIFSQDQEIRDNQQEYLNSMERLQSSLIENSVFSCKKLNWNSLRNIYEVEQKTRIPILNEIIEKIRSWFKKEGENSRMYESSITEDKVLFLRPVTINSLQTYFESNPGYFKSFKTSPWDIFIASAVDKVCNNLRMNLNIKDVRLNTIRKQSALS